MIITVTLNAALDKTVICNQVLSGGITRAEEALVVAGGKGINVARTVFKLGGPVLATGFAGGSNGLLIRDLLTKEGIPFDLLEIGDNSRMCLTILEKANRTGTEIYDPSPLIKAEEWANFKLSLKKLAPKAELISLDGSLPSGLSADAYYDLIGLIKKINPQCQVILDTSGSALQKGIQAKPFMVKPNRQEMETLWGEPLPDRHRQAQAVQALMADGIPLVVLSLGDQGVVYGYNGRVYQIAPLAVEAQSAVGCGDALVGGFATYFRNSRDVDAAVRYGVAAATSNLIAKTQGDVNREAVEKFFRQVRVEQII